MNSPPKAIVSPCAAKADNIALEIKIKNGSVLKTPPFPVCSVPEL